MRIPLVDLRAQYHAIRREIDEALHAVVESGQFVMGPAVRSFEREAADYCGVRHAVAVASGTDALYLALRALGVGPGDEVVTTPFTFIATAGAVSQTGARPVFVDIDPRTFNLDVSRVAPALTGRTRAVLPVHLYGQPAELAPLLELCRSRGIALVEDCAQSFGADYGGRKCGAWGRAGCFSFYPSKNLGAFGDGGMVVTDDEALAARVRSLRDHGRDASEPYRHATLGCNSRLDELQAAVLRVRLPRLDAANARRQAIAAAYDAALSGGPIAPPVRRPGATHVFHQYVVRSPRREEVQARLKEQGVATAIHYPMPVHAQPAYAGRVALGPAGCVETEAIGREIFSLPIFPEMTEEQVGRVCAALAAL